jgi:hypothetical protein
MSKKNLKDFKPNAAAFHEYKMWRFYYEHNFVRLFIELVAFLKSYFGLGVISVLMPGYFAGIAAIRFRKCKGKESESDMVKISNSLNSFYTIIANKSAQPINVTKVADLELHWWLVDRYPEKFNETRVEAIAAWAAELFAVDVERCLEFAQYRSQAMELQDSYENKEVEKIDWNTIHTLLQKSYSSLYATIQ